MHTEAAPAPLLRLRPCPCCGHEAERESITDDYGTVYRIECTGCGLRIESGISLDIIAPAWNMRRSDGLRNWIKAKERKLKMEAPPSQISYVYRGCEAQAAEILDKPVVIESKGESGWES